MITTLSKSLAFFTLVAVSTVGLSAWDFSHTVGTNMAYYTDDHGGGGPVKEPFLASNYSPLKAEDMSAWKGGPSSDPDVRQLGSGWGDFDIEFYYRFRATSPLLQGDGMLTEDNNIVFTVRPTISPATFHLENEVLWKPLAFLVLGSGLSLGTGWPLDVFGAQGMGLNNSGDISKGKMGGLAVHLHFGATLQFDFEALFPGKYNHVVISLSSRFTLQHNTEAGPSDAWYWRDDDGWNFNGWYYKGNYVLGWQPPWSVNFIGFLMEHTFAVSPDISGRSTIESGGWGSDLHSFIFGPVVNIDFSKGHALTILLQFKNGLYYTDETVYNRWFEEWENNGESYIKFSRLALAYSWEI